MTSQPTREELNQIIKELEKEVIECKRSQAALKDSHMELSAILNSAPLIMMLVDQDKQVWQVSNALTRFAGRQTEEIIGKRSGEALGCIHHMDDSKGCGYGPICETCPVRRMVLDTFKTGKSYRRVEAKLSFESDKVAERVLLVSTSLLDTPEKMVLVSIEDITEHKQTEKKLRASEERFRLILESVGDGIFGVDLGGRVEFINTAASRLLGYEPDELIGQDIHGKIHHTHADGRPYPAGTCPMSKAYSHGMAETISDEMLWRKDGTGFSVEYTATPMIRDKQITGAVISFRDITERKQTEKALQRAHDELEMRVAERTAELAKINEELQAEIMERKQAETALLQAKQAAEAANQAKSIFLATMSHELRTPLNAVIGFSEILADRTFGELNARQAKYTDSILKSGRHLLDLVNDILDLAEVETGKAELVLSKFDISEAVHSVLKSIRRLAANKNIALRVELEKSLFSITADELKFKQIVDNLLSNAVKFTLVNGSVTLAAKRVAGCEYSFPEDKQSASQTDTQYLLPDTHKDFIEISVTDSGIGIKPEDQQRIFHTFEQIDSNYSRKQEGTGLGLALAKKLVELHGGCIRVESKGPGKGSTFAFVIPLKDVVIKPKAVVAEAATQRVADVAPAKKSKG